MEKIKATVTIGFNCLGIASSLDMLIEGGRHLSFAHDVPGEPKVTMKIEADELRYLKDLWSDALVQMMSINVSEDELSRLNESLNDFCVARM